MVASPTAEPGSYQALIKEGQKRADELKKKRVSTAPKKLSKSERKRRRK